MSVSQKALKSHIAKISKEGKEAGWEPSSPLGKDKGRIKASFLEGILWIQMLMMPQDQSRVGSYQVELRD